MIKLRRDFINASIVYSKGSEVMPIDEFPGEYFVGYDMSIWIEWIGGTGNRGANLRLYDNTNTTPIDKTVGYVFGYSASTDPDSVFHVSKRTKVTINSTISLIAQLRCSHVNTTAKANVSGNSTSGFFTDPDVENTMYIQRIP